MQKINIHTTHLADNFVWDLHKDLVNLIEVESTDDLFKLDGCNIILHTNKHIMCGEYERLRKINQPIRLKILAFLNKNEKNKIIISNLWECGQGEYDWLNLYELMPFAIDKRIVFVQAAPGHPTIEVGTFWMFTGLVANRDNVNCSLENFEKIYTKKDKPYTFNWMVGAGRPHRIALIQMLHLAGALDDALWSCHDHDYNEVEIKEKYKIDVSPDNIRFNSLPSGYDNIPPPLTQTIRGDMYAIEKVFDFSVLGTMYNMVSQENQYIDSYFTVVAEQWHHWDYAEPNEKILRPILMGHPFIFIGGQGLYKKLKDQGYKTFNSLIDESFDNITDHATRLKRSADVIASLAKSGRSNLDSFLSASKEICEHNRLNLLARYGTQQVTNHYNLHNFLIRNFANA